MPRKSPGLCICPLPVGDHNPNPGHPVKCIVCEGWVYWPKKMHGRQLDLLTREATENEG